jgi:hypothetical protein
MAVWAVTDFFTVEVLTLTGLIYVLRAVFHSFGDPESEPGGMTPYPDQEWMEHQTRNMTMEEWGFQTNCNICCMTEIRSFAYRFLN